MDVSLRRTRAGRQPVLNSLLITILSVSCAAAVAAQTPATVGPLTFDAAIAQAEAHSPALAAARLRAPINRAAVLVAGERPNPEFRVELERETPTNAYGLAMPLEVGGQRKNRIAVSEAVAKTGEAELAAATLEIHVAVRRAYFARLVADARRSMLDDVRTLATRARDAASVRFDAGSAPRLELLQAELALAQADNDTTTAAAASTAARARLNVLLGYAPDTDVTLSTPLDAMTILTGAEAVMRARDANTNLAVLARQIDEARARVGLARALKAPDVVAEGTVTRGAEPEFSTGWRAAVSVTAPIFTRHTAAVAVEQATLSQVTAEREAALVQLETEVAAAATVASARREAFLRYRDQILPQIVTIETMADDSYRLGQTGLAAYLLALQSTRDARLNALQAAADFHDAVAELEHAMGTPLP